MKLGRLLALQRLQVSWPWYRVPQEVHYDGRRLLQESCLRFAYESGSSPAAAEPKESTQLPLPVSSGSFDSYFEFSTVNEKIHDWKNRIYTSMLIYPNFISQDEERDILQEIEPYLSRLHYETAHWDDAIHDYRETERKSWNRKNSVVINRIRAIAFPPSVPQLQLVHVLDLGKSGVIKPHIDSTRFCGNTIAGLSLLSPSVMRLVHDVHQDHFVNVYLPRFCLYVMSELARYEFTHEILGEKESAFRGEVIPRDRRISIMCRNEPDTQPDDGPVFTATTLPLEDEKR